MPLTTSATFASAIETGTDWRDTSKKVLEQLESVRTRKEQFNFGFLYVSDHLAGELSSILNLFKSVLGIESWSGCVAMGVCGNGIEYIDKPAISVMLCHFDPASFRLFPMSDMDDGKAQSALEPWLRKNDPMLVLAHGDPTMQGNPGHALHMLEDMTGGFLMGGLASSRKEHSCISGNIGTGGLCGVVFSQEIPVASALSQGCSPAGKNHIITKCHDHTIYELDGRPALEVFEDDLRDIALGHLEHSAKPHDEVQKLLKGDVHAAFPVAGSDQGDFVVRNITSIDDEIKSITIANLMGQGDTLFFVHRDSDSVKKDLARTLCKLHERVQKDRGTFMPKGALYISCVARAFSDFDNPDKSGEMALVREITGDIPLTGFYASGEINAGRLYSFTGILILFL